jgi:atrial natriuretic peptide receptor A
MFHIYSETSRKLLESLVSSLEEYSTTLEAAIQERTTDYLDEKRKTEELLYELLPRYTVYDY